MRRAVLLLCLASVALTSRARAAEPQPEPEPTAGRRVLAAGAAVFPGFLVHGTGQWVLGRGKTGLRLLAWQGVGTALMLAGGIPIILTGASRKIAGPAAAVTVAGFGLIGTGTLADVYGTTGLDQRGGLPERRAVWFESELGYRYLYDPEFRYHSFSVERVRFQAGSWKIEPSLWTGLDDPVSRARIVTGWRFLGPLPRPHTEARDGSFLDLDLGVTRSMFARYGFDKWTGELALSGRLDLVRIDPVLRGSFVDGGFGWGRDWVHFQPPATPGSTEADDLLLARFGFGIYLGRPPHGGEARVYYDHRRDDWAGGIAGLGVGSSVMGHVGTEGFYYLDPSWGVRWEAAVGSAYLWGVSVLYRPGGTL